MNGRTRRRTSRAGAVALAAWAAVCLVVAARVLVLQWELARVACDPAQCAPLQLRQGMAGGVDLAVYAGVVTALSVVETVAITAVAVLVARHARNRARPAAAVLLALAATTGPSDITSVAEPWLVVAHRVVLTVAVAGLFVLVATFPTMTFVPAWLLAPAGVAGAWTVLTTLVPTVAAAIAADRSPWSDLEGAVYAGCLVAVVIGQVIQYRCGADDTRRRLRTALVAVAVFALVGVAGTVATTADAGIGTVAGAAWNLLGGAALTLVLATFAVAMIRHGAYGVAVVVNRVLAGAAVTAVIVAVYAVLVAVASVVAQGWVPGAVGAAGTAALLSPVLARLTRAVDRLVYGDAADPPLLAAALGAQLSAARSPVGLTGSLVEVLAQRLRFPSLTVRVPEMTATAGTAEQVPDNPPRVATVPIGDGSGVLEVVLRPGQRRVSGRDRRALAAASGPLTAAIVAERLSDSLRRSRIALLTAQEEERRSLRRQLHDEVGPTLASLRHRTGAARRDLQDPEQAGRWLDQSDRLLVGVLEQVRTLSRTLRPPELDDVGLVGAVRQFAAGLAAATSVVDELPGPLPAAVELAAYRVITEAVLNAERHSGAASVQIRLHAENGALQIEVTDDGDGIEPGTRPGVRLTTMRERAEELGGSITVAPGPRGGTLLACELPLGMPVVPT